MIKFKYELEILISTEICLKKRENIQWDARIRIEVKRRNLRVIIFNTEIHAKYIMYTLNTYLHRCFYENFIELKNLASSWKYQKPNFLHFNKNYRDVSRGMKFPNIGVLLVKWSRRGTPKLESHQFASHP